MVDGLVMAVAATLVALAGAAVSLLIRLVARRIRDASLQFSRSFFNWLQSLAVIVFIGSGIVVPFTAPTGQQLLESLSASQTGRFFIALKYSFAYAFPAIALFMWARWGLGANPPSIAYEPLPDTPPVSRATSTTCYPQSGWTVGFTLVVALLSILAASFEREVIRSTWIDVLQAGAALPDRALSYQTLLRVSLLPVIVGAVAGGLASDRFGRRSALIGGILLSQASVLSITLAPTSGTVILATAVFHFAVGALGSAAITLAIENGSSLLRGIASALLVLASGAGGIAYIALSDLLGKENWHGLLYLGVALAIFISVLLLFLPDSLAWLEERARLREHPIVWQARLGSLIAPILAACALTVGLYIFETVYHGGHWSWARLDLKAPTDLALSMPAHLAWSSIVGLIAWGACGSRLARHWAIAVPLIMAYAAVAAMLHVASLSSLLWFTIATGLLTGATRAHVLASLAERFPTSARSTAIGICYYLPPGLDLILGSTTLNQDQSLLAHIDFIAATRGAVDRYLLIGMGLGALLALGSLFIVRAKRL